MRSASPNRIERSTTASVLYVRPTSGQSRAGGTGTFAAVHSLSGACPAIRMYTTRWCGYCVRAKALLDASGLDYEEINLDDDPAFRAEAARPDRRLDGAADPDRRQARSAATRELWRLEREGRLDTLLDAASGEGWHDGQYHVPRPATTILSIGVPHRSHGSPARP